MDLCLSLLKDELPYSSELYNIKSEVPRCPEPKFSQFAFYHETQPFRENLLIISSPDDLPEDIGYKKGTALLCLGTPPEKYLKAHIPILELCEEVNLRLLVNEINVIFQRYNALEQQLNNAVDNGCNIQDLVDIMHPFVVNELNVSDSNHRMVAHSFETFRNIGQSGFIVDEDRDILPVEVIGFFTNNKRWVEVRSFVDPFIYDEGIFTNRLLCQNIIPKTEKDFVYRISFGETEQEFRPYDPYLLIFFAKFVRKVYERVSASKETRRVDTLSDALQLILMGEEVESWQVHHGLSVMKYDNNSRFLCLCMRPEHWDESIQTNTYYCEQVRKLFRGVVAFEYEEDIVCLVNSDYYETSTDAFIKAITSFIRDSNFRMGVSESFTDVMLFKNYYTQAIIALTSGLEETPSQWIHRFQEQAVNYIVKQASKEVGVSTLCAEEILTLYEHDRAHNSNYLETVGCFFENNFNATETAARLNVHRTTFLYRLKKIEELSGIDFNDAQKNLYYQVSIKLLELTD